NRVKFPGKCDRRLERLCGTDWENRIILVTSFWGESRGDPERREELERNERSLENNYWLFMALKKGYRGIERYESPNDGTRAVEILQHLLPR
ncbi:hypothetical protein AN958_00086, partial [Leucoagaricus sp. SymC.cos]